MRTIPAAILAAALPAILLGACAGDDTDATDTDTDTDTGEPVTYEPTWAGMEALFVDHCDRCHPAQQGIDLHTAIPADVATTTGARLYLVPGDPDNSLIWLEVSGQYTTQMPYDGLLPIETVDPMRVWIEAGAPVE
ncbi:MAG: hypothetical protein ABMB14_02280 [Myxococcota bacterium]